MTRALRRRHLAAFSVLVVALPAAFVASVLSRPARPVNDELAPLIGAEARPLPGATVSAWPGLGLTIRRGRESVELDGAPAVRRPDLLVYWSRSPAADGGALPEDAVLLGAPAGAGAARFPLPEEARAGGGALVLFSLGHGEVVSSAALPAAPAGGGD